MTTNKNCGFAVWDGNPDDPSFAYCGFTAGHAGEHGDWEVAA